MFRSKDIDTRIITYLRMTAGLISWHTNFSKSLSTAGSLLYSWHRNIGTETTEKFLPQQMRFFLPPVYQLWPSLYVPVVAYDAYFNWLDLHQNYDRNYRRLAKRLIFRNLTISSTVFHVYIQIESVQSRLSAEVTHVNGRSQPSQHGATSSPRLESRDTSNHWPARSFIPYPSQYRRSSSSSNARLSGFPLIMLKAWINITRTFSFTAHHHHVVV